MSDTDVNDNGPQEGSSEKPELRQFSRGELKVTLEAHTKWLESNSMEGEAADLSRLDIHGTDLQMALLLQANLQEADLSSANLKKAWFQRANLRGTNLCGADLREAHLGEADLQNANLSEANLQGAYLEGANLQRANLRKANLREAFFPDSNLQGAILDRADLRKSFLHHANLQEVFLREANLQEADLGTANLRGADLFRTRMQNANLSDVDLTETTNLLGRNLAGANLTNARLPEGIARFDGLDYVAERARSASKIFMLMIFGCAYSWLTIAATTDARLLDIAASSPLPIIQVNVPIVGFYWIGAVFLLAVYFHLHLYLQTFWEGLADLPAIFPDGNRLEKKVYPWFLTALVRTHFYRLREHRPFHSRLSSLVSVFFVWWIVPLTLVLFWGRCIPRNDWETTSLHIGLLTISAAFGTFSYLSARTILRGREMGISYSVDKGKTGYMWRRVLQARGILAFGLVPAVTGVVFAVVSLGAIEGVPPSRGTQTEGMPPFRGTPILAWVPSVFDSIGYRAFADLRGTDVSTRPENWWMAPHPQELVRPASLKGANLRYADATSAFLAKADLRAANLQRANLKNANLQGAILESANLQGAILENANLQDANLRFANLQEARLANANLQGALLVGANLKAADLNANFQAADLRDANLQGANLVGASLEEAILFRANLQGANLGRATLRRARFLGANLQGARLADANLQGADLGGARLQGAILESAYLQDANLNGNLKGADLFRANLQGANLIFATNLTREQLDAACGNDKTTLPHELRDYQMKPCPLAAQLTSD